MYSPYTIHWTLTLTMKINKCSVLCFPADRFISVELYLRQNRLRQVTPLKYLGVMDDDNQWYNYHITNIASRGFHALGCISRCAHFSSGMRCTTLLSLYQCYVRPILEFGCALFSGIPAYRLRPLFTLEKCALRLCLVLPRNAANKVLYL